MAVRSVGLRVATMLVFAIVTWFYLMRPDRGTIVGVIGSAVVLLGVMWSPRRDPAMWQIVLVLVGLPIALLYEMNNASSAEALFGRVLVHDSVLAVVAIAACAAAFVLALTLSRRTDQQRLTPS